MKAPSRATLSPKKGTRVDFSIFMGACKKRRSAPIMGCLPAHCLLAFCFLPSAFCFLSYVRALGIDVNGIKGLAGRHEQPVALASAEAEIGADFRQQDHANPFAAGSEDVHAIVSLTYPAGPRPDVPVFVGADAVGKPRALAG